MAAKQKEQWLADKNVELQRWADEKISNLQGALAACSRLGEKLSEDCIRMRGLLSEAADALEIARDYQDVISGPDIDRINSILSRIRGGESDC